MRNLLTSHFSLLFESLMSKPLLVFEDIATSPGHHLFTLFGTPWNITTLGWLTLPAYFVPGFVAVWFLLPASEPVNVKITAAILAGLTFIFVSALHEIGHILSARLVQGPMSEVFIPAIRPLTLYHDTLEPSKRVHLGRALGGPVLNLTLGVLTLLVWQATRGAWAQPWLTAVLAFLLVNLLYGVGSLLPIPSVDGEIIWRELLSKPGR
jgi:Zn-dependent protease